VLEFLGSLAAAGGADELGRLAGQSGRGLAVALARVVALHRPDNVSGCLECRSMRRCRTWDGISGPGQPRRFGGVPLYGRRVEAVVVPTYRSQEWLFDVAAGQFDVDLAISGMEPRSVQDLLPNVDPRCGYDVDRGAGPLRAAVASRYGVAAEQVLITHGAQGALYLLYAAILNAGDEVVVRSPGWQQTTDLPARFGATARTVAIAIADGDRDGASRTVQALSAATRMLVLNSPHNPTGLAWNGRQWASVAAAVGWPEAITPDGTPFALCRVLLTGLPSHELCLRLLAEERLLVMPGDVFGAPGCLRFSYARPEPVLRDGLQRPSRVLVLLGDPQPVRAGPP